MPIYLPTSPEFTQLPVHEQLLSWLKTKPEIIRAFGGFQSETGKWGFVVVRWTMGPEGMLLEYLQWTDTHHDFEGDQWEEFDSPTVPESPYMYRIYDGLTEKIFRLRRAPELSRMTFGSVFWIHPEAMYRRSLFALLSAQGSRFPSSPRQ